MTTAIELLCLAGIAFNIRFVVALAQERKHDRKQLAITKSGRPEKMLEQSKRAA